LKERLLEAPSPEFALFLRYLLAVAAFLLQECCKAVALIENDVASGGYIICGSHFSNQGEGATVDRFLNRLLGLCIAEQAALFSYFEAALASEIKSAKSRGEMSVRLHRLL
jgi:hypothetical protein